MRTADRKSRRGLVTLLAAAAVTLAGCATGPNKVERFAGSAKHPPGEVVCTGLVALKVNNTYGVPVDLIAHASGGRETFVGTLPTGRSEYTIENPDQTFEIRRAGTRERLESGNYLPAGTPSVRRVYIERSCAS